MPPLGAICASQWHRFQWNGGSHGVACVNCTGGSRQWNVDLWTVSFFFFFGRAMQLVGSYFPDQAEIEPQVKAQYPNYWAAREFPGLCLNSTIWWGCFASQPFCLGKCFSPFNLSFFISTMAIMMALHRGVCFISGRLLSPFL